MVKKNVLFFLMIVVIFACNSKNNDFQSAKYCPIYTVSICISLIDFNSNDSIEHQIFICDSNYYLFDNDSLIFSNYDRSIWKEVLTEDSSFFEDICRIYRNKSLKPNFNSDYSIIISFWYSNGKKNRILFNFTYFNYQNNHSIEKFTKSIVRLFEVNNVNLIRPN